MQRGHAPQGRLCAAMSLGSAPVVQGQQVGTHSIVLLRDGEEFVLHAPEGTHFFALNVDTVRFAKLAAFELSGDQLKRLTTRSQLCVDDALLLRIRQRIYPLFRHLLEHADAITRTAEKMLEDELLTAFLDLFSNATDEVRCRRGNFAVSAYLVKRCQELIDASGDTPLSILDLCEHLRVSRRTLQNSFQAVKPAPQCRASTLDRHPRQQPKRRRGGRGHGLLPSEPLCCALPGVVWRVTVRNPAGAGLTTGGTCGCPRSVGKTWLAQRVGG